MPSKLTNRTTRAAGLQTGADINGNFITFENGIKIYSLIVAITPNVTTTTASVGSIALTSHATGRGRFYFSDGTKWQNMPNA